MEESTISVIVPVYNGEQYIEKCMQTIVNQTYRNLEIIVVDDGSTDSSAELCAEWEKKDPRVKLIRQKNGGLSNARNTAMRSAHGDLIGFVDIDDWIHPQMFEILFSCMQCYGLDMVSCNYQLAYDTNTVYEKYDVDAIKNDIEIVASKNALEGFIEYYKRRIRIPVWCKLYKSGLIKEIGFVEGKVYEDEYLIHRIIGSCDKIGIIDTPLYYYYQSPNSIIRSGYSIKRFDIIHAFRDRYLYLKELQIKEQAVFWGKFYIQQVLGTWHELRVKHRDLTEYYREHYLKKLHEDSQLLIDYCKLNKLDRLRLRWAYSHPVAVEMLSYSLPVIAYRKLTERYFFEKHNKNYIKKYIKNQRRSLP